jgi:phytoene dehydrogenase-like protein
MSEKKSSRDTTRACVIGSGPNGLSAAIVLAQAGIRVEVFEAEGEPGGAARTLQLTLPGFLHDFGPAVLPMAAASPFFKTLPLAHQGLEWIHGASPLAHPLDDGTAVMLEQNLGDAERALGEDGQAWRRLMQPFVDSWAEFAQDAMGPLVKIPRHPFQMAHFGLYGLQPATMLADAKFKTARTRALFAGLAAHSFLNLDAPLSSAVGLMLGAAAHAVGWPVPKGGAGALTRAVVRHLESLGGTVHTSRRIAGLRELGDDCAVTLFDTTPKALAAIAGDRVSAEFRRVADRFTLAPGAFKVDYALREPVPWRARDCGRAITVHLGGSFEEIAASEDAVARGLEAQRPFVLVAQPSLFDSTRAPQGQHVLWAYCHVPNGSRVDMTERIEAQIERFAPGFRDCVLQRRALTPAALQTMDANLLGGDISGGAVTMGQFFFRPSWRGYATGTRGLYLCSSSTPPGGGVHGMCGFHAARLALRHLRGRERPGALV